MEKRKLEINEHLIVRDLNVLLDGAKNINGKNYLTITFDRLMEDVIDLSYMEIHKISPRKFQLCYVVTECESYDLQEDNIFFTADWYDIKRLNNVHEVTFENALFGQCTEWRSVMETTKEKRYVYYSKLRPVGPGTFPKTEHGPVDVYNYDERTSVNGIMAWGYLTYTQPLTENLADSYDLVLATA